jgi:hypothetical protein
MNVVITPPAPSTRGSGCHVAHALAPDVTMEQVINARSSSWIT